MRTTVVVVSYRLHDWLEPCLRSVMGQADEVILVDNGSPAGVVGDAGRRLGAVVEGTPVWPPFRRPAAAPADRGRPAAGGRAALRCAVSDEATRNLLADSGRERVAGLDAEASRAPFLRHLGAVL